MPPGLVHTRPRFFYGYWILIVGVLCQIITHGCGPYAFSLYVLPLQNEFGWSRASIMTGVMIWSLITGLASPFVGQMINRWGTKRVIATGALVMSIGFALLSLAHSLWQFYLLYSVVGLGSAATGVVPTSTVTANWFKKRRGFAIGILGTGIGLGGFLVPRLLSNFIMPSFSYSGAYLACAIMSAVVIIPLSLWLIKDSPEEKGLLPDNGDVQVDTNHITSNTSEIGVKLGQARKSQAFWLMVVAFTTFGFAGSLVFQNQVPHLEDIGFPAIQAAGALQGVGIGSAIGKFAFGWLCDYIRPKYTLIIGGALQAGAALILINITGSSPVLLLWMYGILLGLGVGSWLPAVSMNTSYNFGLINYSVIFGIYNSLFMTAGAIGPVVGGHIFDTNGSYHPAFSLCLIFYVIAMVSMMLVRPPTKNIVSIVENGTS